MTRTLLPPAPTTIEQVIALDAELVCILGQPPRTGWSEQHCRDRHAMLAPLIEQHGSSTVAALLQLRGLNVSADHLDQWIDSSSGEEP